MYFSFHYTQSHAKHKSMIVIFLVEELFEAICFDTFLTVRQSNKNDLCIRTEVEVFEDRLKYSVD